MQELDIQRRLLAELEVSETFEEMDRDQFADSKSTWILNYKVWLLLKKKSREYQIASRPFITSSPYEEKVIRIQDQASGTQ